MILNSLKMVIYDLNRILIQNLHQRNVKKKYTEKMIQWGKNCRFCRIHNMFY